MAEHSITETATSWSCTCGDGRENGPRDEINHAVEAHMVAMIMEGHVVRGAYKPIFST